MRGPQRARRAAVSLSAHAFEGRGPGLAPRHQIGWIRSAKVSRPHSLLLVGDLGDDLRALFGGGIGAEELGQINVSAVGVLDGDDLESLDKSLERPRSATTFDICWGEENSWLMSMPKFCDIWIA